MSSCEVKRSLRRLTPRGISVVDPVVAPSYRRNPTVPEVFSVVVAEQRMMSPACDALVVHLAGRTLGPEKALKCVTFTSAYMFQLSVRS